MPGLDYAQHVFAMAVSGGVIFLIAAGLESVLNSRRRLAAEKAIEQASAVDSKEMVSLGVDSVLLLRSGKCSCIAGRAPPTGWQRNLETVHRQIAGDMVRHDLRTARLDRTALRKYGAPLGPSGGCMIFRLADESDSLAILAYRRDASLPGLRSAELLRRKWRLTQTQPEAVSLPVQSRDLAIAKQESALMRLQFLRVAHDLRMPLSTILLLRERLKRELTALPGVPFGVTDALDKLVRQIDQLRLYLDSLLAIESGQLTDGEATRLCPGSVMQALVDARQAEFERKNVHLLSAEIDSEWTSVLPPPTLMRVLDNLLANALRFTPPGKSVRVGAKAVDGKGCIWVEDSGPGLSLADFEEYVEMGRRNLGRSGGGHGIGLAAAFEMSRAMGGRLTLETPMHSSGARFLLVLPTDS
jgi:signal transduction histidine kinase